MIITIDGTSGSGKSTSASKVALRLGFTYLDTGAMYRAITYKALRNGSPVHDPEAMGQMIEETDLKFRHLAPNTAFRILLDGEDVTESLRTPEVDRNVSLISSYPQVRVKMVELQRRLVRKLNAKGVICEGRDMGTVVFPDAEVKIYLDASLKERAKRRQKELEEGGIFLTQQEVEEGLSRRDHFDTERKVSPLRKAEDSISIDTTNLSIEEEIEKVIEIVMSSGTQILISKTRIRKRWRWIFGVWFLHAYFHWLLGAKVKGRENIPGRGSLLIASNHLSFIDPPLVGWAVYKRELHFLAHENLFHWKKGLAWLIRQYNSIPLKRKGFDRKAFRKAQEVLKNGGALVIFPEGTRSRIGRLLPPRPGLGLLAHESGAQVIPARIIGSELPFRSLLFRRNRWGIQFGKAMDFSHRNLENPGTTSFQEISDEVMKEISRMKL